MLPTLKELRERVQGAGSKILDETISMTGLQADLCARYGYGLTVPCEGESFFFHLPDIATDSWQASMLQRAALPDEELLLRLRRRVHPGAVILEACAGFGARTVFYAKAVQAAKVYALSGTKRGMSLCRKNSMLNDVENTVQVSWMGLGEDGVPSGTLDGFCREQQIGHVDLISLDKPGLGFAGLEGAAETLRRDGPAVIIWDQGLWTAEAVKARELLKSLGYAEPEAWTSEVSFWVFRV